MRRPGFRPSVARGRIACILLLVLASCSTWPPHKRDGPPYFRENRAELNELRELFEQSDYVDLSRGGIQGPLVGRKTIEVSPPAANPPSAKRIVELLEETLAIGLYQDKRGVRIKMGEGGIDGKFVSWWFHVGGERIRTCDDDERERSCSLCQIDLDEEWSLRYRWRPEDLDETEAECVKDETWMSELKKMREAESQ